jgi:hypothetical protein
MTDTYDRGRRRRAIWIALMPGNYDTPGAAATTTSLVAAPATPRTYGTLVTLTATISAGTGTVTFFDGAAQIGTPVALTGLTAALPVSALTVGSHSLTARYNGDATHAVSTSTITPYTIT